MLRGECPSSSSCGNFKPLLCLPKWFASMANGEFDTKGGVGRYVVEVMGSGTHKSQQPTHRLNVIGFFCPVPVAEAKKAFTTMAKGEVLELLADDPEVLHDLPMLIERSGHRLISIEESMGEYCFLVEVTS